MIASGLVNLTERGPGSGLVSGFLPTQVPTVVTEIIGTAVGRVYPVRPPEPHGQVQATRQEVHKVQVAIDELIRRARDLDPCQALLGCVAEGFRKNALDQREEHKRKKLLDKGFVVHYINKPNWPKKVQHTSRR
jgi:hypothetical protein